MSSDRCVAFDECTQLVMDGRRQVAHSILRGQSPAECRHYFRHRHPLASIRQIGDRNISAHRAPRKNAAIDAGPPGLDVSLDELSIAYLHREGGAGNARRGDFQNKIVGYELVADGDLAIVHAFDDEVFAKGAGLQRSSKLACPPAQRQGTLDINGLITAAMMPAIADGIAERAY